MTPIRAAAVSRVQRARRERDDAAHALARLSEPAAALTLAATFTDLPDVRALLLRRAERCAAAHDAAVRARDALPLCPFTTKE